MKYQNRGKRMTAERKEIQIGEVTEDGWVYVGEAKGENKFAKGYGVFAKGYGVKEWQEAMDFAVSENAHLGSDADLDLLQTNIIDKGLLKNAFDKAGIDPSATVWGSLEDYQRHPYGMWSARTQRLSDGDRGWGLQKDCPESILLFQYKPHR